ncbi:MAG: M23 family metallopeptidase [Myxococcota bacterium]
MPPSPREIASSARPTPLDVTLWVVLGLLLALLLGTSNPVDARTATGLAAVLKYGHLPVSQHFDFPVGGPDAAGYHCAQEFGENLHLGEDWNSNAGDDLGEPVTTIARGEVTYAAHAGAPWGNVVRVVHHVRRQGRSSFVESVYAHLDVIEVEVGEALERGARVGTIGDADGRYGPHLHLEVRRAPDLPLGPGYSSRNRAWLDPTAFILDHR